MKKNPSLLMYCVTVHGPTGSTRIWAEEIMILLNNIEAHLYSEISEYFAEKPQAHIVPFSCAWEGLNETLEVVAMHGQTKKELKNEAHQLRNEIAEMMEQC